MIETIKDHFYFHASLGHQRVCESELRIHEGLLRSVTLQGDSPARTLNATRRSVSLRIIDDEQIGFCNGDWNSTFELLLNGTKMRIRRSKRSLLRIAQTRNQSLETRLKEKLRPYTLVDNSKRIRNLYNIASVFKYSLFPKAHKVTVADYYSKTSTFLGRGPCFMNEDFDSYLVAEINGLWLNFLLKEGEDILLDKDEITLLKKIAYCRKSTRKVIPKISCLVLNSDVAALLFHECVSHNAEGAKNSGLSILGGNKLLRIVDNLNRDSTTDIIVDDEGFIAQPMTLVSEGKLIGNAHSMETAIEYGVEPNGRGWAVYGNSEPAPRILGLKVDIGKTNRSGLIEQARNGLFLIGAESGTLCDQMVHLKVGCGIVIRNGELCENLGPLNIQFNCKEDSIWLSNIGSDVKNIAGLYCGKNCKSFIPHRILCPSISIVIDKQSVIINRCTGVN